jgi:DNA-binding IclR family transcriptional regulator
MKHSSSLSPQTPDRENVQAVTRALRILDAFFPDEQGVSLSDLSRRLGMGKTTVLRTARTLARADYLAQLEDGRWRLGPAAGWLGVRYQTSFDVRNVIDSVLRQLTDTTGETTALFVLEGSSRTCVARVERPSLSRHYIRVGEKLPLDKGASGSVLLAFTGEAGALYDDIRRHGFYLSIGQRDANLCSVSTPVFAARGRLFGALCVSGETHRLGGAELNAHLNALIASSETLSRALAANAIAAS